MSASAFASLTLKRLRQFRNSLYEALSMEKHKGLVRGLVRGLAYLDVEAVEAVQEQLYLREDFLHLLPNEHTSAYVSIRLLKQSIRQHTSTQAEHTSAYKSTYISIHLHTSAREGIRSTRAPGIRQHTSTQAEHTSTYVSIPSTQAPRAPEAACRIRQHTPTWHTSAYV